MLDILVKWDRLKRAELAAAPDRWGVGKCAGQFYYKSKQFLPYLPEKISTLVDIGCGNGSDISDIRAKHAVTRAICVDIKDFRAKTTKEDSIFVGARLGQPLEIEDAAADVVLMFHSLHHIQEDIAARLADIARITRDGGVILLRDHDVQSEADAELVDFEHFVYLVPEVDAEIGELMADFPRFEPMTYYAYDYIRELFAGLGFEAVYVRRSPNLTSVYNAVFRKTGQKK
jgi:SAM-dependent methyltransferase